MGLACRKHGSTLAEMVLERQLRVLHIDPKAAGRDSDILARLEFLNPQSLPPVTYFFQQSHPYSNKTTDPKSATPSGPMGPLHSNSCTMCPSSHPEAVPLPWKSSGIKSMHHQTWLSGQELISVPGKDLFSQKSSLSQLTTLFYTSVALGLESRDFSATGKALCLRTGKI